MFRERKVKEVLCLRNLRSRRFDVYGTSSRPCFDIVRSEA